MQLNIAALQTCGVYTINPSTRNYGATCFQNTFAVISNIVTFPLLFLALSLLLTGVAWRLVISVSQIDLTWGALIVVHTVHVSECVHQSMILLETVRPKTLTVFTGD